VALIYSLRPASVVEVGVLSIVLPAPGGEVIRRCSALQVVLIFIPIVLYFYHKCSVSGKVNRNLRKDDMAKLTEYAKCAVCQFCHYWWFSFLGPTARIGGYSTIFHWPPYVGGPMRTILPVSFSFDMYFFIVVVDFERVFDIFLDEIFGFFFHARLLAAVRYPAKI